MRSRLEILDLTPRERQIAARIVSLVGEQLPWERVEAIFRSLARAEWMILPKASQSLQRDLPMQSPTLLRNERIWATAIVLALHVETGDEESAERIISFLAQRGAALDAVFIGEAAAMCVQERARKSAAAGGTSAEAPL